MPRMSEKVSRQSSRYAAREENAAELMNESSFQDVLEQIASRANQFDQSGDWPREDLDDLASIGAMKWAIPRNLAGEEFSPIEIHERYEQIAASSLATALILTQRDSAVQILAASENVGIRDQLMPTFAGNEKFTTVGIAQLATRRQGGAPALIARREKGKWRLAGYVPWCTGAAFGSHVVIGAAVEGTAEQILILLPTDLKGVT